MQLDSLAQFEDLMQGDNVGVGVARSGVWRSDRNGLSALDTMFAGLNQGSLGMSVRKETATVGI